MTMSNNRTKSFIVKGLHCCRYLWDHDMTLASCDKVLLAEVAPLLALQYRWNSLGVIPDSR
jgi:hypothetical protein